MSPKRPSGMFGFSIVWVGQIVSLLGTSMTGFAMTIWAYEKTGSATALALVAFFFITPMLIMSPFAGAFVDRHDRKFMMMISDLGSGIATIGILILYTTGHLQIWHLYVSGALQGTFQTFQWPAYSAAITTMLPKEQYGRANGMLSLAETGSGIFAPLLAGSLIGVIGISGILAIDIVSFTFAIGALLVVHVPKPQRTEEGQKGQGSIWKEAAYGFRYILARPSLLGLQTVFLLGNFFASMSFTLIAPMILASTGNNEIIYGAVNSAGAVGGVVGGVAMSAWGGPKKRIHGVLLGWFFSSLLGITMLGIGKALPVWAMASFVEGFFVPIINGSNQAIWQSKVAPDLQGRVFSIRRMIAWFVNPLATLIVGPLADYVFEPSVTQGGLLSGLFGWLVGIDAGSGMALIFVFCGLAASCVAIGGYTLPFIRNVEVILPDHDTIPQTSVDRLSKLQELLKEREELLLSLPGQVREEGLKDVTRQLRQLGQKSPG